MPPHHLLKRCRIGASTPEIVKPFFGDADILDIGEVFDDDIPSDVALAPPNGLRKGVKPGLDLKGKWNGKHRVGILLG
jgi:hypothetical protein